MAIVFQIQGGWALDHTVGASMDVRQVAAQQETTVVLECLGMARGLVGNVYIINYIGTFLFIYVYS